MFWRTYSASGADHLSGLCRVVSPVSPFRRRDMPKLPTWNQQRHIVFADSDSMRAIYVRVPVFYMVHRMHRVARVCV